MRHVALVLFVVFATGWRSAAEERPNVILFIADDVSWNDVGCYGNTAARTPHIDALASRGIRFDRAFLTASSCSPSRSSIITGRYPHNTGKAAELHQAISGHLPWFPELLRDAGYYTALSGKHHMKTSAPQSGPGTRPRAFDHVDQGRTQDNSGGHANWVRVVRHRPRDKPFFFWFAANDAHRRWDADVQWDTERYGPMHSPGDVVVPPFLSDDPETRRDLASYYNEVTRFDFFVGSVVAELTQQGVLENTLIYVMADNGRPFPRAKTRLHDSGMRTPLVAHWPDGIVNVGPNPALVSAIDLAPTILSLTGAEIPKTVQGKSMLPLLRNTANSIRRYAFSEHNWHDYESHGRSVRTTDFVLVKNFRPRLPWQGPADSVRSPSHRRLLALQQTGKLTAAQQDVFLEPRPNVEFYNMSTDPYQLTNLAQQPRYGAGKEELLDILNQWMDRTGDSVPAGISPDTFDRETGERLPQPDTLPGIVLTPGEDRNADLVNDPGPF